jgi:hypothetical protein
MNVQQAVNRFQIAAKLGRVNNARTGMGTMITDATAASIVSTAGSAFRFAAGIDDLTRIEYDTYAEVLADWALADAEAHGLSDGSNRAARCRRFVRTVDGRQYKQTRPLSQVPVPVAWQGLGNAVQSGPSTTRERNRRHSRLVKLATTLGPLGIRTPHDLPNRTELVRLLSETAGLTARAVEDLLGAYRAARQLAAVMGQQFPDIDQCPVTYQRGLRALPDIIDRLAREGYTGSLGSISTEEMIERLAPAWSDAMLAFMKSRRRASDRWKRRVVNASSRTLAEVVRAGSGELRTAHPTRLLVQMVDTGEVIETNAPGGEEWARDLFGDAALPVVGYVRPKTIHIPLIAHLATSSTEASSRNSSVHTTDGEGGTFWTDTVQSDVQLIGDMGLFAGRSSTTFLGNPEIQTRAESELASFRKRMREDNALRGFGGTKGKESLLKLATYPMILFLGLPALRRCALRRREDMHRAMLRHENEPNHSSIRKAAYRYDKALLRYVLFAVFYADGLRAANYTHARLGPASKEGGMVTQSAPCGTDVRSYTHVEPKLDGVRLVGVSTNFFGDDHPQVKLKVDMLPGTKHFRSRPHWIRPGLLDSELLEEYLTVARARNLARQGLITRVEDYDLSADIRDWHFALFVSPTRSTNPYRAVTGAFTLSRIAEIVGQTLHWVVTTVLGRTVPAFGSAELAAQYSKLFAPHVSRLQAGSFVYGILGRADQAQTLLNDTLQTVERRYTVVEASMVHKTGWEAPHFFDELFKRVWDNNEVIDWDVVDPLAGIPADKRPPGLDSVV